MNDIEVWRSIKGYEGIYQVSSFGNVKSLASKGSGRFKIDTIMKPFNNGRGYMYYSLNKPGKKVKNYSGHRLVVEAFLDVKEFMPDINHKNGIKKDNRLCNLERVNKKMNMIHASLNGLLPVGEKNHLSKLKEGDILKIKKLWGYNVHRQIISDVFCISFAQIHRIISNKSWKRISQKK